MDRLLDGFLSARPELACCRSELACSLALLESCFAGGGKVLVCGNGGSAADAEHIVGELMKGFLRRRCLGPEMRARLKSVDEERGAYLGDRLQGALPAIALTGQYSLSTAVANDNGGDLPFAQQVFGYGSAGDVFWGISTSGNSPNVVLAATVAKAKGLKVLALTGAGGGALAACADVALCAPSDDTFRVQEHHVAIYHFLCATVEERFFPE